MPAPASDEALPAAASDPRGPEAEPEPAASARTQADRLRLTLLLYLTAVGLWGFDRITKYLVEHNFHEPSTLIPHVLQLQYTTNSGGAFGVFDGAVWLFLTATLVVCGVIVFASFNLPNRMIAVALGLVLGGALGNLTDRAVRGVGFFNGHVVDFLAFASGPTARPVWPVFNVADSAIVVGAALILFGSVRKSTSR
jgi:signal peptidase II